MVERAATQAEVTFVLNKDYKLDVKVQSGIVQTRPLGTTQPWVSGLALTKYKFDITRGTYTV